MEPRRRKHLPTPRKQSDCGSKQPGSLATQSLSPRVADSSSRSDQETSPRRSLPSRAFTCFARTSRARLEQTRLWGRQRYSLAGLYSGAVNDPVCSLSVLVQGKEVPSKGGSAYVLAGRNSPQASPSALARSRVRLNPRSSIRRTAASAFSKSDASADAINWRRSAASCGRV